MLFSGCQGKARRRHSPQLSRSACELHSRQGEHGSQGSRRPADTGGHLHSTCRAPLLACATLLPAFAYKRPCEPAKTFSLQAYERLCPGKTASAAAAPPAEAEATDISALIASEVADLKDASKQTFYWHSVGISALTYVEVKDAGGWRGGWGLWVQGACSHNRWAR